MTDLPGLGWGILCAKNQKDSAIAQFYASGKSCPAVNALFWNWIVKKQKMPVRKTWQVKYVQMICLQCRILSLTHSRWVVFWMDCERGECIVHAICILTNAHTGDNLCNKIYGCVSRWLFLSGVSIRSISVRTMRSLLEVVPYENVTWRERINILLILKGEKV